MLYLISVGLIMSDLIPMVNIILSKPGFWFLYVYQFFDFKFSLMNFLLLQGVIILILWFLIGLLIDKLIHKFKKNNL